MSKKNQANVPQKIDMDDGYFPLAQTALLTLSKTKLSGAQRAIIDVIFTQTYGYYNQSSQYQDKAKKRFTHAQISYEFFMESTWMGKQEVSRAINQLVKWGILGRDKNTSPYTYWFVVHTEKWAPECWRVSRIANSKQDSEQFAGVLTNSSQDSEQGVSRIANSSQVSAQALQGLKLTRNKRINKREIKEREVPRSTSVTGRQKPENGNSNTKEIDHFKYLLNLSNTEKISYFEKLEKNKQLALCVRLYNYYFPEQAKKFGKNGAIKARQEFEETIKRGIPAIYIAIEILFHNEQEREPPPWEIKERLLKQWGLEQTEAQFKYYFEQSFGDEVGYIDQNERADKHGGHTAKHPP